MFHLYPMRLPPVSQDMRKRDDGETLFGIYSSDQRDSAANSFTLSVRRDDSKYLFRISIIQKTAVKFGWGRILS